MGMPITVEIIDAGATPVAIEKIFEYFKYVDEKFSPFKKTSEITKINNGEITEKDYSSDMKAVFLLSEKTKKETDGYFDITDNNRKYNPSGLVKGWSIFNAAELLKQMNFKNFYVEAGGDIQVYGKNTQKSGWKIGIRNPFKIEEIVKVVYLSKNEGVATSGTYIRGQHIYNPKNRKQELNEIVSISVIGPDVYEADRFATAAFAMQRNGINFIEKLDGFEAYMIDKKGIATMTSNFQKYT
jgi:thiamine biosynthesis lipoprotein